MSVLYSNWSSTWYPSGSSVARKIRARLTYSLIQTDTNITINAQGAVCVYKDNLKTTINGALTLGSSTNTGSHPYTYDSSKGGGNTETYYTITALNSSATYQKKENSYTVTITLKASRGSSNATSVSTTITIPALNKKTVSFYDESVLINTQSVTQGSTATYLDLPDRDGKHLVNWLSGSTSGNAYDFSTPVNTDLNLYASWANNNYTITFKSSNPGIPVNTGQTRYDVQSCTVGNSVTLNSVGNIFNNTFSKNYLFLGWSREPNGEIVFADEEEFTVQQVQGKKQISENFNIDNEANNILYAVWVNKYIKPTIKNLNVYRSSTSGSKEIEDETGTHAHISLYITKGKQNQLVSGTFNYETVELQTNIKIEYKLTGTEQYTLFSNETITNEGEYTKVITGPLDMSSYNILITVFTPSPSSLSVTATDVLSAASFIMDIDSSGRGIGIFSVAPKSEEVIKNTVSINGVLNLGEAVTDNNRLFINNNGLECYYGGNSVFQIGVSEAVSQPTIETYSKQEIYNEQQNHYKDYELDATPSGSFTIRGTFATKYEGSMIFTVSPEQYSIQQPFEFTFDSYVLNDSKTLGNITVTLRNVNGSPGFRISYSGELYRYGENLMMSLFPISPGESYADFMDASHPPIDGGYVSNYNGYTGIYENLIVQITNSSNEVLATVEVPPTQAYNTTLTDLNLTISWSITDYSFSFTNSSSNTYKVTTIRYSYAAGVFYNVQAVYSISDQEPTLTIGSRLASQYGANSATIGTGLVAAIPNQLVIGQYNVPDDPTTSDGYPFIIGNGGYVGSTLAENNVFMIDWNGDIYPQGQKMADFIIEERTSGDWTYRKWKSGKCEAWMNHNYNSTQYAFTTSGGSGRYYYYNSTWVSANAGLPKNSDNTTYVFASVTGAWCNLSTNAYISSEVVGAVTTGNIPTALTLRVWTPYSATVTFYHLYVYVVGTWA